VMLLPWVRTSVTGKSVAGGARAVVQPLHTEAEIPREGTPVDMVGGQRLVRGLDEKPRG
jgi:hypothetical protein